MSAASLPLDPERIRAEFPAFRQPELRDFAFFDNAGGSYTSAAVLNRMRNYYWHNKVQPYGAFPASREAGAAMDDAYFRMALAMNLSADWIHFGPSTSANTYALGRAFEAWLRPADAIIVTNQDHEANTGAWRKLGTRGVEIREWKIDRDTGRLSLIDLDKLLDSKVRMIAMPHVSNIVGVVLLGLLCAGRKHFLWGWAAAASVLLGLFAKEVALAGMFGVAILEFYEARSLPRGRRLLRLLPIAVATIAYFGARAWAMGMGLRENGLGWRERVVSALEAAGRYVWMTLDGWHPMIHIGHLGSPVLRYMALGGVALLCIAVLSWRFRRRLVGEQLAMTAVLAVSVFLVLHLVPITINVVVADRFMYLPLAALTLCLAPLVASVSPRRATLGLALLAASYAPVTFARARVWADEVAFWSTAFREQSVHNAMSRLELGNVYGRAGLQSYALALYLDANPADYVNYLLARHNAGTRLVILGRYADAKVILEDLVQRAPEIPKFHFSLASAYLTAGRYDESEKELDIALRLYPESISALRLKRTIARIRSSPAGGEPDLSTVRGKLVQVGLHAQAGRHKDALDLLIAASAAPDITLAQLTEGVLYTFDWGTPKQLTTLYERYRAHGGSAPAIIDNYEMRMERVRRLRALWPSLGNGQPSPTGT